MGREPVIGESRLRYGLAPHDAKVAVRRYDSRILLLAVVTALVAACELRLAVDVRLDAGGSGTFELLVALDEELADDLRATGIDLLAGIEGLRESAPDWRVEERDPGDGGVEVRATTAFADPDEFRDLVSAFHTGLDGDDPRLFDDLRVVRHAGGAMTISGEVGFVPPSSPGVRGQQLPFDPGDLARVLEERGDELVRYDLRVTLPAPPSSHDADEVEGATLTWSAPIGEMRAISARSQRPSTSPLLLVTAGGAAVLVAFVATYALRRRGSIKSGE